MANLTVADVRRMLNGGSLEPQAANVEPVASEPEPPILVETVMEEPMQTTETVEIFASGDIPIARTEQPRGAPRRQGKGG